jgi:hypothetical protein
MHRLYIFEGPPACGKTTFTRALKVKLNASLYQYKRLGLANILIKILIRISPNIRSDCKIYDSRCQDPVVLVNQNFIHNNSFFIFFLEIIYKSFQYTNILVRCTLNRTVIVDEGPSMGWANYQNLKQKNCFSLTQVQLLMALDLQALNFLAKFCCVELCFIDRAPDELLAFWFKRKHIVPYSENFADLVRDSFKLLQVQCAAFVLFNCVYLNNPGASQKLLARIEH